MSAVDKAKNKIENVEGKVKEKVGKHRDDPAMEAKGHGQQVSSNVKDAGEKVKDALKS